MQKKHPDYSEKKDDSIWTFEKLNNHINVNYQATKGVPDDWVLTDMTVGFLHFLNPRSSCDVRKKKSSMYRKNRLQKFKSLERVYLV